MLSQVGNNMQLEGRTTFKAKQQYVTQYKLDMPPAELLEKAKLVGGTSAVLSPAVSFICF